LADRRGADFGGVVWGEGGFWEVRGICRLCGDPGELRESHILPKFVYKRLRVDGDSEGPTNINLISKRAHPLVRQAKQYLFCENVRTFSITVARNIWQTLCLTPREYADYTLRSVIYHGLDGSPVIEDILNTMHGGSKSQN
jgi:hypothetical protein